MVSFRKLVDFGSYIPGVKVLKLVLVLQLLILTTSTVKVVNFIIGFPKQYPEILWSVLSLCFVVYDFVPVLLLWKCIKKVSEKYLKWFVIFRISLFPVMFPLFMVINLCAVNDTKKESWNPLYRFLYSILPSLIRIYSVCVIYTYYKKLVSPIMTHLHDYCHTLKERRQSEVKNDTGLPILGVRPSSDPDDKDHIKDVSENLEKVDPQKFENYILSPLDVIIDVRSFLGEGEYGMVYKGTLHANKKKTQIAAKIAKGQSADNLEMLLQEIKILIYIGDHENIVKFYGATTDSSLKKHPVLVVEYCSHGCLEDFLIGKRHTFVNFEDFEDSNEPITKKTLLYVNLENFRTHSTIDLIRFASDIARGMEHLSSKRIMHGDLASRNVLVTSDLKAKLTDFGMSQRLYDYQLYSKIQHLNCNLPWRWMSIEAIEDLNLSEKSEVWSYGVTLWEIFTLGEFPYKDLEWSPSITKLLREGSMQLEKPRLADLKIWDAMKQCWNIDPKSRPTFTNLKITFENILEQSTRIDREIGDIY